MGGRENGSTSGAVNVDSAAFCRRGCHDLDSSGVAMIAPLRLLAAIAGCALTGTAIAADTIPAQPLGKKTTLLVGDTFEGNTLGSAWRVLTPTFVVADGVLKGTHTFFGSPATATKPARPSHGAVLLVPVNRQDTIIEFRFRMDTATAVNAVCDDTNYKDSHAGHITRVAMTPTRIRLGDDKESLSHEIEELKKDPKRKAEVAKRIEGKVRDIPFKFDPQHWYRVSIENVGDEMRLVLDDQPIGYLKSSGLAHPTKTRFHFTVNGGEAEFDDFKIWNVERN
jgi:hypothetical protein